MRSIEKRKIQGATDPFRSAFFSVSFFAVMLVGCAAPGMQMNLSASDKETTEKVGNLNVTLRPLSPEVIRQVGARPLDTTGLGELLTVEHQPYRIGAQDVLLVTIWEHPELTQPLGQYRTDAATGQVVDEEGFLFFPYAGKLQVKGLTTVQVREMLTQTLSKVLQNPQIDVKVVSFRSQKMFIGGEVKNPGVYPITEVPMTLSEAVGRAGGFLSSADASRIVLTRGEKIYKLDFQRLISSPGRYSQILMQEGDVLHISSRDEEKVYLLGELRSPRALPLFNGNLSLAQALSEGGGLESFTADARSIFVIRSGTEEDQVDVYHLDARNPAALVLADKFALIPRDIVYVDAVGMAHWNRMINLLLPTANLIKGTTDAAVNVKTLSK